MSGNSVKGGEDRVRSLMKTGKSAFMTAGILAAISVMLTAVQAGQPALVACVSVNFCVAAGAVAYAAAACLALQRRIGKPLSSASRIAGNPQKETQKP